MDFNLTEEQALIKKTAGDIARDVLAPRAAELDRSYSFPRYGLDKLAETGMMGMVIPPPLGGAGTDTLSFLLATEELAKACPSTALVFVTHVAASLGILVGGKEDTKRKLLPQLARGEKLAAFAATETGSGSNPLAVTTTARTQSEHYAINGSKVFITSGGEADAYVVLARTSDAPGPAGLSALLVEKGTPGFTFGRRDERMGLNGTSSRELFFDNCLVPRENLLGQEGGYLPLGMAIAGLGALGAAAMAVGIAQAALDASIQHGKERLMGGQPIGNFQGVQFLVSEMSATVNAGRAFLYWAAFLRDNPPPGPPVFALKAKLFCTEMAVEVAHKALQVHGGQGYTRDLPIERYYRDARGLTLHFSPSEPLKETIGRLLMGLMPM
ncbi:MAG: acyl-CoA dehydrogenase family protein [Chloroflexi bacterium]|nr:acyl-CoA dehydrogenase family protein [Chloroflexota bacterium]